MTDTITRPGKQRKTEAQPPYNVVLLDDDEHSFEYVIRMLKSLFGHPPEKGLLMAMEVHTTGRVIVATTHLEHAELKRDQIQGFGPDPLIPRCKGSMSAVVEPASG
jgi:ATP-dependent Clp protease adaptor protein ClpS